jgi:hypothetical protein
MNGERALGWIDLFGSSECGSGHEGEQQNGQQDRFHHHTLLLNWLHTGSVIALGN